MLENIVIKGVEIWGQHKVEISALCNVCTNPCRKDSYRRSRNMRSTQNRYGFNLEQAFLSTSKLLK